MSVDNPVQVGAGLSTPVRRLGREKLAERTVETVLHLTPDTETVVATLHGAGLRFSRKAETVRREAARTVRTEAKGFDFSIFADLDELQEQARLSLQEAVDTFLHLLAQAEDERFQIEQITQNTTVEQRLNDPAFRARREAAGRVFYQAWHGRLLARCSMPTVKPIPRARPLLPATTRDMPVRIWSRARSFLSMHGSRPIGRYRRCRS